MHLYGILATYQKELAQLEGIIENLEKLEKRIDSLYGETMETISVDEKAYRADLIESSKEHIKGAIGYISGTALPILHKKIEAILLEIKAYEASLEK